MQVNVIIKSAKLRLDSILSMFDGQRKRPPNEVSFLLISNIPIAVFVLPIVLFTFEIKPYIISV